jgi:hypothetical protein
MLACPKAAVDKSPAQAMAKMPVDLSERLVMMHLETIG